jgi:hypothetical protein
MGGCFESAKFRYMEEQATEDKKQMRPKEKRLALRGYRGIERRCSIVIILALPNRYVL